MQFAEGQRPMSKLAKLLLGSSGYSVAKAARLALPLRREQFSQNGEDVALRRLLPQPRGVYLDVGSGNPVHLSNTYLFYRAGWRGVVVDPLSTNHQLSRAIRPMDIRYRALVSRSAGDLEFFEMDPSVLSTTDPEIARSCELAGAVTLRRGRIPAVPISDLPFHATPDIPSFMSIDVEGHELEVLKSINWERQSPRFIVIELWSDPQRAKVKSQILDLLEATGYSTVTYCGPDNVIFGHGRWSEATARND